MAKTNTEKIDELSKLVASLTERLDNVRKDTEDLAEIPTKVAVLEQQISRLVKTSDDASHWRLSLLQSLISLFLGGIITLCAQAVIKHFWP